jgi:hypothetical protein
LPVQFALLFDEFELLPAAEVAAGVPVLFAEEPLELLELLDALPLVSVVTQVSAWKGTTIPFAWLVEADEFASMMTQRICFVHKLITISRTVPMLSP